MKITREVLMLSLRSLYFEWKIKNGKNRAFMALGLFFLAVALTSVFIPILPQIPFAILAAYFFGKGSLRLHLWIRHNKYLGAPVRDWEDFKIIRMKTKIVSSIMMVAGAVLGHLKWGQPWAYMLDFIMVIAILYVTTRRSRIFPRSNDLIGRSLARVKM
jgi:uncharacterized membrane protein YbaN (DUF454 family)